MEKEELLVWLKKNKWRTKDLADILGVSTMWVSTWRCGRRPVPQWLPLCLRTIEREKFGDADQRLNGPDLGARNGNRQSLDSK